LSSHVLHPPIEDARADDVGIILTAFFDDPLFPDCALPDLFDIQIALEDIGPMCSYVTSVAWTTESADGYWLASIGATAFMLAENVSGGGQRRRVDMIVKHRPPEKAKPIVLNAMGVKHVAPEVDPDTSAKGATYAVLLTVHSFHVKDAAA
jgi:hypothetical protein